VSKEPVLFASPHPRIRSSIVAALLCLAAPLTAPGCKTFEKPKYEVGDRRLLLVPFRDFTISHGHGYGESEKGKKIVQAFRSWTEKNFAPRLTDSRTAEGVVRELLDWPREKITTRDWKGLLRGVETDLVLVGELRELRLRDPKTVGFFKGTATARYTLIDAVSGREAFAPTEVKVEYPAQKEIDNTLTEFTDPQDIERGLISKLGEQIGKELFGYYSER
jgi:hypothetical protein